MKNNISWIVLILTLLFWPISFISNNQHTWLPFFVALFILGIDYLLFTKKNENRYFLYLLLPLVHPGYLIFPFVAIFLNFKKIKLVPLLLYIAMLIILAFKLWGPFYSSSIFIKDPLALDSLSKKITLIPSRNLARIFENKTTPYQEKYMANIFISLDLNNYFFALHPQEVGGNQNLNKYPFLAIIFFLVGLFSIPDEKSKTWLYSIFLSSVLSLAFLSNQDKLDLIMYLPISLLIYNGLNKIKKNSYSQYLLFLLVYIPFTLFDFIRLLI